MGFWTALRYAYAQVLSDFPTEQELEPKFKPATTAQATP